MQHINCCTRGPEQAAARQEAKPVVLPYGARQRQFHRKRRGIQVKLEESGEPVTLLAVKEAACTGPGPCSKGPEGIELGFIANAVEPWRRTSAEQPVQHERAACLGARPRKPLAAE